MYSIVMNGFSLFIFGILRDGVYLRQGVQGYLKGVFIGRRVLIELLRYVYLNYYYYNNNIIINKCIVMIIFIIFILVDCDVICVFLVKWFSDKCRVFYLCKKKFFSGKLNGMGFLN